MRIAVVVVTCNRLELLKVCLGKLKAQSRVPDEIIVVNNGSTDGTTEWLKSQANTLILNQNNLGSSGGFCNGMKYASDLNPDWVWVMDDDCNPAINALEEIIKVNPTSGTIYGSIALSQHNPQEIVWWLADEEKRGNYIVNYNDLTKPIYNTTHTIPFLGMFVSKETLSEIGYPQTDLFLWNDDEEYCLRAKAKGIKLCYVVKSILTHPPVKYRPMKFLFFSTYIYETTNQKNRYFFRNSTYVAKKYNSYFKFYFFLFPVKILKAFISAYSSDDQASKFSNLKLYLAAIIDGLRSRLGVYF